MPAAPAWPACAIRPRAAACRPASVWRRHRRTTNAGCGSTSCTPRPTRATRDPPRTSARTSPTPPRAWQAGIPSASTDAAAVSSRATRAARAIEEQRLNDNRPAMAALRDPGRLAPAVAFAATRGHLQLPVNGTRIRDYGAPDTLGRSGNKCILSLKRRHDRSDFLRGRL